MFADDGAAAPAAPWAALDAMGRTLLHVAVRGANGQSILLVDRAQRLPATGRALLTSGAHGADTVELTVLVGARPMADACRRVGSFCARVPAAPRGIAQLLVSVFVSASDLRIDARDMQTGATFTLRIDAATVADGEVEPGGEATRGPAAPHSLYPDVWRYEAVYARGAAHPGHTFGERYVVLPPAESGEMARESDGSVEPAATAAKVWPCAYHLAEWLYAAVATAALDGVRARRVIELGAGSGLPGLAAWAAGAVEVCLTDLPANLPRLHEAVELNGAADCVGVTALDWTSPVPAPLLGGGPWDVILAADCVFWPTLFGPLLDTLRALATPRATRIYLAVGDRLNHGPLKRFSAEAEGGGWRLREIGPESCDGTRRDAAEGGSCARGRWLAATRGYVLLELTPPPTT